jgi:predicted enzyme related to lactoylglutathione lyase
LAVAQHLPDGRRQAGDRRLKFHDARDNLSIAKLGELGGRLVGDIHDSPGFGRWVECADDQGVRFGLRQSP